MRIGSLFKVNEYITLKLEDGKTNIYVAGELFLQCKYLLLSIQVDEIQSLDEIKSIDEAAEILDKSQKGFNSKKVEIPSEVEFWGHCSNLQAWYENNYDTRLLHSNLSLPLLKKLTEAGDSRAKKVFKKEVLQRLEYASDKIVLFLLENNYLKHFTKDELLTIYEDNLSRFNSTKLLFPSLNIFSSLGINIAYEHYKEQVKELLSTSDLQEIVEILKRYGRYFLEEDRIFLFDKLKSMKTGDSKRGERSKTLSRLMSKLEFYGVNFKVSYIITTLLRDEEQKIVSNILLNSQYSYVRLDFQADIVHKRLWREELYYEFFEGHVVDLELLCEESKEKEFYENLNAIRHLEKLEHLNLLFFCDIKYNLLTVLRNLKNLKKLYLMFFCKFDPSFIEYILADTNIEIIKLYKFSNINSLPRIQYIRY